VVRSLILIKLSLLWKYIKCLSTQLVPPQAGIGGTVTYTVTEASSVDLIKSLSTQLVPPQAGIGGTVTYTIICAMILAVVD
jgi:hypothetical protein